MRRVITICGLAGSGKGTIAKAFARKHGWKYIDIGLMFRAITYTSDTCNEFSYLWKEGESKIIYHDIGGDRDVTDILRTEKMGLRTARMTIGGFGVMVEMIEKILKKEDTDLICDGRNAGIELFPKAEFKFCASATVEERARRRQKDLQRIGCLTTYENVLNEIKKRDWIDTNREKGKAKVPEGVVIIDTEQTSVEEAVQIISRKVSLLK